MATFVSVTRTKLAPSLFNLLETRRYRGRKSMDGLSHDEFLRDNKYLHARLFDSQGLIVWTLSLCELKGLAKVLNSRFLWSKGEQGKWANLHAFVERRWKNNCYLMVDKEDLMMCIDSYTQVMKLLVDCVHLLTKYLFLPVVDHQKISRTWPEVLTQDSGPGSGRTSYRTFRRGTPTPPNNKLFNIGHRLRLGGARAWLPLD